MGDAIRKYAGFIILFILGIAHLFHKVSFDWPVIVVFIIALLPQISGIIEYLKAGKDGVEMKLRTGFLAADEVESVAKRNPVETNDCSQNRQTEDRNSTKTENRNGAGSILRPGFASLSEDQKRLFKSLWHYQKESCGLSSNTRWGFTVPVNSLDYSSFVSGLGLLVAKDLVTLGRNGLVFLTNRGIEFGLSHDREIQDFPLYYKDFEAV